MKKQPAGYANDPRGGGKTPSGTPSGAKLPPQKGNPGKSAPKQSPK